MNEHKVSINIDRFKEKLTISLIRYFFIVLYPPLTDEDYNILEANGIEKYRIDSVFNTRVKTMVYHIFDLLLDSEIKTDKPKVEKRR